MLSATAFSREFPLWLLLWFMNRSVMGPLTASALKPDRSEAVTDGAVLLKQLPGLKPVSSLYRIEIII